MKQSIAKIRFDYVNQPLMEKALHADPIFQFKQWFQEAIKSKVFEPNGMILATVSNVGKPSSRTVLLKHLDRDGFGFFTDYNSRKGEQLALNPYGSLTFWWKEIYRQVNVEGKISKMVRSESQNYFNRRPKNAQLAALASRQSAPLASRAELDENYLRLKKEWRGQKLSCPDHWGGYILEPERMEFWQGRENRLHDRFLYVKADGDWLISRLSP